MQLVKQTRLYFQQGKSDKVYEVDLCEVAEGRFVVNFRYGRRGATLREGTKTTNPVAREEADRIFDQLVSSKTQKGYTEGEAAPPTPPATPAPAAAADTDARKSAILNRILEGHDSSSPWRLSRAIWRAGELKLLEAEPLLHPLVGREEMTDYSIAWTMARLGQSASVPALERIAQSTANREHVRHFATQALRMVADDDGRASLVSQAIESLPDPLRSFLTNNSGKAFTQAFLDGLNKQYDPSLLSALYYIDTPACRDALIRALETVPLKPPFFRTIRRIFKTAELRRDGQIFGLLAYRMETERCTYRRPYYLDRNYKSPMAQENPEHAFSVHTRQYFRRRIWRNLNRMAQIGDADFVPMAVGVLLPFSDKDGGAVRTESRYDWSSQEYSHLHHGAYSSFWAFNQLLYRNSRRFEPNRAQTAFRYANGADPRTGPPVENEAAYPELWQSQPKGLVHLLTDSRCLPVHQFAAKTLRSCREFCESLPMEVLILFLGSAYEETAELGFDLVVDRYDPSKPNFDLVLALAQSNLERARGKAREWIEAQRQVFFANTDFAAQVLTSPHADTRKVGLDSIHTLPSDSAAIRTLAGRLIAFLQSATEEEAAAAEDVGNALLRPQFQDPIATLGEEVICDLLASSVVEVQSFAGSVVTQHKTLAQSPTERVLTAMLNAPHPPVRSMAITIISELPDDVLAKNIGMLATLTCHELDDIRNDIRPTVKRLADEQPDFAKEMSSELIRRLLTPGAPEGVPTHTSVVLREDFGDKMQHVSREVVWQLLQSRSGPAQEVGGHLLPTNVNHRELAMVEIVKLTNHATVSVRRCAWGMYEEQVERMRAELSTAVRILDSSWDDSREFGFQFFRDNTTDDDMTPDVMISICDSVRDDVQQFGRQMITKHFAKEDGPDYLLRLSEHPTADLQLFASNFLAEYGANHPDRIRQLLPYFVSILSRVNKSRVAKDRILQFLQAEAAKDRESATAIAGVLARISATCAVGDRAHTIEAMLELHEAFPEIDVPLSVKQVQPKPKPAEAH